MSASKPYAHAQHGKLVLVVVLVLPYTINQLIKTSTWEDKGNQFNWLQTRFLWITDTEKCFLKTQYRQTPSINYGQNEDVAATRRGFLSCFDKRVKASGTF